MPTVWPAYGGVAGVQDFVNNRIVISGTISDAVPWTYAFTPAVALRFDAKTDDGFPNSGKIRATGNQIVGVFMPALHNGTSAATSGGAGTANCVSTSTTPNQYNASYTSSACSLLIDPAF